ncbi:hypothetical protein [Phenylobacterium sp.]|jgi:hypothetical protein|uniref:hypothetical protein n=1 Tax=Phenylobacterium sp. TaxID=1871053 RepID=UPI0037849B76
MPTIATLHEVQPVNSSTAGVQVAPVAASLADGSHVVVWQDVATSDLFGQRFDASGERLGGEFRINTTPTANLAPEPSIIGLEGGGFAVAWAIVPDPASPVFKDVVSQLFDASGVKVGGEQLNLGGPWPGPHGQASLAALAGGGYVVTIVDHQLDVDTPDPDVYSQRYDASGTKVGEPILVNAPSELEQRHPATAGLTDGGFVVVWDLEIDSIPTGKLLLQRLDAAGDKVGGEIQVTDQSWPHLGERAVTGLADGGYVVVWTTEEPRDVFAQRFNAAGARVGSPVEVGRTTPGDQSAPSVIGLADGGYAVVWFSHQYGPVDSPRGLHVQTFSASGERVGSEALISSDVALSPPVVLPSQPSASLAALDDGGLVVAWVNSDFDIVQRRIGPTMESATLSDAIEIASGASREDTFLAAPGALNPGDQIYGGAGSDRLRLTDAGEIDLTGVLLNSVEKIMGSRGDDTVVVDDAALGGVTVIDGAGGEDTVVTSDASLNLIGKTLAKIEHLTTTHAAGTNFLVDSISEALLVDGAGTHDTITATSLVFSARQRNQLFANGVEEIVDASGAYTPHAAGDFLLA